MRGLKGRPVLVTGGANGTGAAIVQRLAEEGCIIGIFDLDGAAGDKAAQDITARGGRASAAKVDISDYHSVQSAVEKFEADFGPAAFLVNNAGWDRAANFIDTTPDFWSKITTINLIRP